MSYSIVKVRSLTASNYRILIFLQLSDVNRRFECIISFVTKFSDFEEIF